MQPQSLTARAPAKLILSGEHAVLYDQPALAVAIDRYTTTTTRWRDNLSIHFKLTDLAYAKTHTLKTLRRVKRNLHKEYQNFLQGKCGISTVLKKPFELLQYSVSNLLEYVNIQLPRGVEISVDSNIPIGCGMGSSAAAVISSLYALSNFLQLGWQRHDFLNFARNIENLQHGKSSGVDLHLVTYGGCVMYQNGAVEARESPILPLHIINTGKPASSTGECVAAVANIMDKKLAAEFGAVTAQIDQALTLNDMGRLLPAIKHNHHLLQTIKVVPDKVANFINDLESTGAAAKICGAGAVYGDSAGIVLVTGGLDIQQVVDMHGYTMQTVEVDTYGTKII